jgi:hypothetical protein
MKHYYVENTISRINLIFFKTKKYRSFFSLGNPVRKNIFTFFLFLVQVVVFGATNTYTGSTITSGQLRWSTAANWSLGRLPSSADDVVIPSGKTVTLDVLSVDANSITISGMLELNKGADINLYSSLIVVTSPSGNINFDHSVIRLSSDVALYLQNGSASLSGSCNNNDEIYVGTVQYTVCTGGGGLYLFDQIETDGGINTVKAGEIGTAQSICSGNTPANLSSPTDGSGSGIISYEWQTNASGSYATINGENLATYQPPLLLVSTSYQRRTKSVYGGTTFYSVYTTPLMITVNTLPAIYSVTGTGSYCSGGVVVGLSNSMIGVTYQLRIGNVNTGIAVIGNGSAISFGLKTAGTYTVIATNTSTTCSVGMAGSAVVTLSSASVGGIISGGDTVCSGTNSTVLTLSGYTGTITKWQLSPSSIFDSLVTDIANTTTTLTAVNLSTTTYYRAVIASGTCSADNSMAATIFTTVNPMRATVGEITQPDCITATGIVVLTDLPLGIWTINPGGYSGNTTTTIINGLGVGSYNFKVTNAIGCTSVASESVVINAPVTNTWSGGIWSRGIPPTSLDENIVFADNYSSNADVIGCSCLISGGKNVIIKEGHTLKIKNGLDVQSTATLTFENKASLLQINGQAINAGNIIYKRKTTPIDKFDYTYWSSPVKDQMLLAVSPNTLQDKFYSFNSAINNWKQENPSNVMEQGKGYIIRGPQEYITQTATSTYEASFIGIPSNGSITSPIGIATSFNLIGNPYPSALDADSFLIYNKDFLNGTIYFWTHNIDIAVNNPNPGSGVYAYSSNDYASYNLTGGVATRIAAVSAINSGAVNTYAPSGKIASGQSFFTTSIAAGNVTFNNSMRVGGSGISGDNSQFFKLKVAKETNVRLKKNRIWLNLSNNQGVFKQTLVGYITGATDDYDSMFDGESANGNDYVDFYSVCQDKKLVIQGRSLPFSQSDTIQLGYSANFSGALIIDIDQLDGELKNQNIFIEDKEQHIIHDLTSKPYEFVTEKGIYNDRFVMRYTDEAFNNDNNTLGINEIETTMGNQVLFSNKNKQISIISFAGVIDKIIIFDTVGKRIYNKTAVSSQELKISNLVANQQLLFVKVFLQDGKSIIKKMIY